MKSKSLQAAAQRQANGRTSSAPDSPAKKEQKLGQTGHWRARLQRENPGAPRPQTSPQRLQEEGEEARYQENNNSAAPTETCPPFPTGTTRGECKIVDDGGRQRTASPKCPRRLLLPQLLCAVARRAFGKSGCPLLRQAAAACRETLLPSLRGRSRRQQTAGTQRA